MKTFFAFVLMLGLLAASGFAQPVVGGVLNNASYSLPPLQNSSIAQGSLFAIFGTGMGPATCTVDTCNWNPNKISPFPTAANPLPTSIPQTNGTTVSVTVSGTTVSVFLYYVLPTQIGAILPSSTPVGTGTLTVTYNGAPSNAFPITVAQSSFGIFTWNEQGTGPGRFLNAITFENLTPLVTVAPTTDYVSIWGTGLGPVADPSTEQTTVPPYTNLCSQPSSCPVTVWVGNQQATVQYAGRGGFTGLDQINFQVPPGAQGCYVQVAVEVKSGNNSVISNFASVAVDPNHAACQDADGINYSDIASILQSKGHANVGNIILYGDYLNVATSIGITAQWDNDTVSGQIGTFTASDIESFQGFTRSPSANYCTVLPFTYYPPAPDPTLGLVTFLDAGASLTITGTSKSQTVAKDTGSNSYGAQPAGNLNTDTGLVGGVAISDLINVELNGCPGTQADKCLPFFLTPSYAISGDTYTVTGPGGSDVGAITVPITVTQAAAQFQWTNQSSVAANPIDRTRDLEIDWTGGDANGFVDITAIVSTATTQLPTASTPGVLVECIAPASSGKFMVPAYVLQSLPSTATSTSIVPPGELLVGPASATCSSTSNNPSGGACGTQLTLPSGLDALYIFYRFILGTNVVWQ